MPAKPKIRPERPARPPKHPTGSVWLRLDLAPGIRIGPGKITLLEQIQLNGSIAAAGRALGMSYKRAWELAAAINAPLAEPAVVPAKGGAHGGGAVLTPVGMQIVQRYRQLERRVNRLAASDLRHLAGLKR